MRRLTPFSFFLLELESITMSYFLLFGCDPSGSFGLILLLLAWFCWFREPKFKNCPRKIISQRITSLLHGWKMRRMCISLIFRPSLLANFSQILLNCGMIRSLHLDIMRVFQVGLGHPITGKSRGYNLASVCWTKVVWILALWVSY